MLNEGESPDTAVPIIATTDATIVAAVADAFVKKLGGRPPAPVRRLSTPRLAPAPKSAPKPASAPAPGVDASLFSRSIRGGSAVRGGRAAPPERP
jgi:hypothetical protein